MDHYAAIKRNEVLILENSMLNKPETNGQILFDSLLLGTEKMENKIEVIREWEIII